MTLAALLLAAACTPLPTCGDPGSPPTGCATPTPTLRSNAVIDEDLAGYSIYYREPGGAFQLLRDLRCELSDRDGDGTDETRVCRLPDISLAVQQYCASCTPGTLYEFAVKAYDAAGNRSAAFSNVVAVCPSPLWPGPPAVYE